jgi:SAM-dependent methyltransferase
MTAPSFDPYWKEKYRKGHSAHCPYDIVFSFIYRHAPKNCARSAIRILEVGCGSGNNIWFGAGEGFSMTGIDGSSDAIDYARNRLKQAGLNADITVGDFTKLPYPEEAFDFVIDRASLTHSGFSQAKMAVSEIHRVLVPGGKFFCNTFSAHHTSAQSGRLIEDNLTIETTTGALAGYGQICFYRSDQMKDLFPAPWKMESLKHLVITETLDKREDVHAEWRAIASKVQG